MNLNPFFEPKSILIIGASRNELTFNWTLIKNLREARYHGNIYLVHPEAVDILGIKCFNSLNEIPELPELAIVMLGKNIDFLTFTSTVEIDAILVSIIPMTQSYQVWKIIFTHCNCDVLCSLKNRNHFLFTIYCFLLSSDSFHNYHHQLIRLVPRAPKNAES